MQTFYHPAKRSILVQGQKLPHILGLSASPVTNGKEGALEDLERNLDAVCKSPTRHLKEFSRFVNEPRFDFVAYLPVPSPHSALLKGISDLIDGYDIYKDPYMRHLAQEGGPKNKEKFLHTLETGSTFCLKQLKALSRRGISLHDDLGSSFSNAFILECITRLTADVEALSNPLYDVGYEERKHLNRLLSGPAASWRTSLESHEAPLLLSAKTDALIRYLDREYQSFGGQITAIIFVQQRSTAWTLSYLLNNHPLLQGKYKAEPFVGAANAARGFQLIDLVDVKTQDNLLQKFRAGQRNICVATPVMEEGVDVPATNLVIRFDAPANFRSFIQSRGRARQVESKFVALHEQGSPIGAYKEWKNLENIVKEKYASDMRWLAGRLYQEGQDELSTQCFSIELTGSVILAHFLCSY